MQLQSLSVFYTAEANLRKKALSAAYGIGPGAEGPFNVACYATGALRPTCFYLFWWGPNLFGGSLQTTF